MRRFLARAVVLCAVLTAFPATSASASGGAVIADCTAHGKLTRSYSVADLQNALATIPASVKEYGDCYDVIQRALLAQLSGRRNGSAGGGGGGSFLPTPVIVVLVLLALAAATLGALALRRRSEEHEAAGDRDAPGDPDAPTQVHRPPTES